MSQPCAMVTCKQLSRVLCDCCNKNLCLDHLTSHSILINHQSSSLNDQINILQEQFKGLNMNKLVNGDRQKLNKWRDDSLKRIHRFYETKCEELNRFLVENVHQQEKEMYEFYKKLIDFNQNPNTTNEDRMNRLQTFILDVKQKIDMIEQNGIPINIRFLPIDNNLITIGQSKIIQEFHITNLSLPYQTFNISEHAGSGMASNNQSLLIDQTPHLTLFDKDLIIIRQLTWKYGAIRDICWSFGLTSFIVITEMNRAYLVNGSNLSTDSIEPMFNQLWMSCTCSNSLLYLVSLSNAVVEFSFFPSLCYSRRWDQPETCQKNEFIKDITCNDDTLALIVVSYSNKMVYLILRSLETFDQLCLIHLDIRHPSYQLPIRCCPFKNNEWLVIEANTSHLFHVDNDGKVIGTLKYDQQPYNAVLFGSQTLVIRTENTINFHDL